MRNIITVPDPVLRKISKPVEFDNKTNQLVKELVETLIKKNDPPGVGLSAVQTSSLTRIFLTYLPPVNNDPNPPKSSRNSVATVFINPEYVDLSEKMTLGPDPKKPIFEGCLSIPRLYGPVLRHESLKIKYYDVMGTEHITDFSGFPARVIQHEFDHLDAILFTDFTLKQNQPIFFDQDGDFIEVTNPEALLTW